MSDKPRSGHEYISEPQVRHHAELKAKFCQASEAVAKLFLGHTQSYQNGVNSALDEVREWAEAQEGPFVSRKDLLRLLEGIEPPPSAAATSKEMLAFSSKKRAQADDSVGPPCKRIASAASGFNQLSIRRAGSRSPRPSATSSAAAYESATDSQIRDCVGDAFASSTFGAAPTDAER
ncbi:hypothetical protein DIPPA_30378 [Diplonema papillatum]|nr:hypothetical protein DIPPA_30378 [Diplonema papillatum]|eukprot:gene20521-31600_t